jgi:hypothetical protein
MLPAMRPLTALAIIGATTLALGILAFGGWYWVLGGPERHADGDGDLASRGRTSDVLTHAFDQSHGTTWTIGVPLCLERGSDPAVLDGTVGPVTTVGGRLRFLGAYTRESVPGAVNYRGGSVGGYPPNIPGPLHTERGFAVSRPCDFSRPDPAARQIELLVGVAYAGGSDGGGWYGLDIGYETRGHHHVLATTGWNILVCGPAMPAVYCPTT